MRGEILNLENGDRVIVGKIKPIGDREFCLEIHRGETGGFKNMHVLLTRMELNELEESIGAVLEPKRDPC